MPITLSEKEKHILTYINNNGGKASNVEIAKRCGIEDDSYDGHINMLLEAGLVKPSKNNYVATHVEITDLGKTTLDSPDV